MYVDNATDKVIIEKSLVRNIQDNMFFDNNFKKLNSIPFNRKPAQDNELASKNYIDYGLNKDTLPRFN